MKVVILAGGLGTRLSEYTKVIPKPMVKIGSFPIIVRIMHHYLKFGFNDFIIATGYKSFVFKKYFKNFKKDGIEFETKLLNQKCKINILDTGKTTLTGGRLKRVSNYLKKNEDFMFTYGDGLSSVNLKNLLHFHKNKKKLVTVTAVRPPARFGEILIKKSKVILFKIAFLCKCHALIDFAKMVEKYISPNDLNIFESDLNIGNTEPLLSSILFNFVIFTPSIIILF